MLDDKRTQRTESEGAGALSDPDPFAIAYTLLAIVFGGGAYLEARRQREFLETRALGEFRKAWFDSRRTLIHARRVIEEFETYVAEDRFGTVGFLFGKVKLAIDVGRAQQLRRLHSNAHTTAGFLAENLDRMADGLGADHQEMVERIHQQLQQITQFPATYSDVIRVAREAIDLYQELLDTVGEKEEFEDRA